jgi:hypothetical protein
MRTVKKIKEKRVRKRDSSYRIVFTIRENHRHFREFASGNLPSAAVSSPVLIILDALQIGVLRAPGKCD